jgi:hypothetical protein
MYMNLFFSNYSLFNQEFDWFGSIIVERLRIRNQPQQPATVSRNTSKGPPQLTTVGRLFPVERSRGRDLIVLQLNEYKPIIK